MNYTINLTDKGNTTINGAAINEVIFEHEMVDYKVVDRSQLIDDLISWIAECGPGRDSDRYLMKQDLKYLITVPDEYIFSSISTNDYIVQGDEEFDNLCREILKLNTKDDLR